MRSVRCAALVGCALAVGCAKSAPVAETSETPAPVAVARPAVASNPPATLPTAEVRTPVVPATLPPSVPPVTPAPTYGRFADNPLAATRKTEPTVAPLPRPAGEPLAAEPEPPTSAQEPKTEPKEPPAKEPPAKEPPKDPKSKDYVWPKDVNGRNVAEWAGDLDSKDASIRESAVKAIPLFGPDGRKACGKRLIRLVNDADPGVRIAAVSAMSLMGFETQADIRDAVTAMRQALNNTAPGSVLRLYVARALATYGTDALVAMADLSSIAKDPWWETRQAVANTLGRLGAPQYDEKPMTGPEGRPIPKKPASELAHKTLRSMLLNDTSSAVRLEAAYSFISHGPPYQQEPAEYLKAVKPYQEMVETALKTEKDKSVQIWLHILTLVYDEKLLDDQVPKIAKFLETPDPTVRVHALNALAMLGPKAKAALKEVRDALGYEEDQLVAAAVMCMASFGKEASTFIPDLENVKKRFQEAIKKAPNDNEKAIAENLVKLVDEAIDAVSGKKKDRPLPEVVDPKKKDEPKKS